MRSFAALLIACSTVVPAFPRFDSSLQQVTVLVDFEQPHAGVSLAAMQSELQTLLGPVGLRIDLRLKSDLPDRPEFSDLVVFKMKGSCTLSGLPVAALSDERGPLAMAYASDGELLHFGAVECDRVRESLRRVVGPGGGRANEAVFGRALGLVVAHEMYHMMANSKTHTRNGVTKHSLSAQELLSGKLALAEVAREAIRREVHSERPPEHH
jgi:hypothetical protein